MTVDCLTTIVPDVLRISHFARDIHDEFDVFILVGFQHEHSNTVEGIVCTDMATSRLVHVKPGATGL